ncbi:hypothetical protein D3C72_2217900 [compost metagenome]
MVLDVEPPRLGRIFLGIIDVDARRLYDVKVLMLISDFQPDWSAGCAQIQPVQRSVNAQGTAQLAGAIAQIRRLAGLDVPVLGHDQPVQFRQRLGCPDEHGLRIVLLACHDI